MRIRKDCIGCLNVRTSTLSYLHLQKSDLYKCVKVKFHSKDHSNTVFSLSGRIEGLVYPNNQKKKKINHKRKFVPQTPDSETIKRVKESQKYLLWYWNFRTSWLETKIFSSPKRSKIPIMTYIKGQ